MDIRKVVLIHPGREGQVVGRAIAAPYTLMRLASLVPPEIPVDIWDENQGPLQERLSQLGPNDLVGITSKTLAIESAERLGRLAQKAGATVVVGGAHTTLMPDEVARWADVIVTGEAYVTWPQLIQDALAGRLQPHYDDTSWVDLAGVAPITDRVIRIMDENRRYWTPMMEITRGCPRNCSFCVGIRVSGQQMRLRPVEEVVEEIQRRSIKRFFLTDDNFGLVFRTHPDYIEKLLKALAPLPLQGWTAQGELIIHQYPELLDLARRAHMDKILLGLESINPANRRELGGKSKGLASEYRTAIRNIQDRGIGVVGLFVFGFDHDTPQTLVDTWDFIRTSGLDGVSMTVLTPYPGTPFRAQLLAEDRLLGLPWRYYDTSHVTYQPKLMTVEEMEGVYDWFCRTAYSPVNIARRGFGALGRHPVSKMGRKLFGSFSTDYGYRRTYDFRKLQGNRLLGPAWAGER